MQWQCCRGGGCEQHAGNIDGEGGEGGEDGMLEDVAIRDSWGTGLRSGKEGVLVLPGAVTNQLVWFGKVMLLMVGLSLDSLWTCVTVGTVVWGIKYAQEMAKTRSQTQQPACALGCTMSAGHVRGEVLMEHGGK